MGLFSKVNEAESTKGGIYFKEGIYRVRIERVFKKEKRGGKVMFLIVETEVLESNNPLAPVGYKPSVLYGDDKDATPGNIKGFFGVGFAALSCLDGVLMTPSEAEKEYLSGDAKKVEKFCEEALEEGALVGLELTVDATIIKTRADDDFTKIIWGVPADTSAKARAA